MMKLFASLIKKLTGSHEKPLKPFGGTISAMNPPVGNLILTFYLPKNRVNTGYFIGTSSQGNVLCHGRVLGKADNAQAAKNNNPSRNPVKPFGDTPTGYYHPTKYEPLGSESERYGMGWLPLEGATRDALRAMEAGRTGIAIHSGRYRSDGALVPTYGCLRVTEQGLEDIADAAEGGMIEVTVVEEPFS